MTAEELALHNLPVENIETRIQMMMDLLVQDNEMVLTAVSEMIEKVLIRHDGFVQTRLSELVDVSTDLRSVVDEVRDLKNAKPAADDQASIRNLIALMGETRGQPTPTRRETLSATRVVHAEEELFSKDEEEEVEEVEDEIEEPSESLSYETLSFADAAANLQREAKANDKSGNEVRRRFQGLHKVMAREAKDAEAEEAREGIPGESDAFPSDMALK
jgi:hypothetical protein